MDEEARQLYQERKEMDEFQNKQLEQIIWLIKGNPELEIEGMMPASKRMELKLDEMESSLVSLMDWKKKIDLATSAKTWKLILKVLLIIGTLFLGIKHGWNFVIDIIKDLL